MRGTLDRVGKQIPIPEMFYSFPSDSTQIIQTYVDGTWQEQRKDDHVSFHRDGRIHTMHKEANRKQKSYRFNAKHHSNAFELHDDHVLPLMIHSFFLGSAEASMQTLTGRDKIVLKEAFDAEFPSIDTTRNTIVWELTEFVDFTIVLFALGRNLHPSTLPPGHPISRLVDCDKMQPILLPWSTPETILSEPKVWAVFSRFTAQAPDGFLQLAESRVQHDDPKAWHLQAYGVCPPWRELDKLAMRQ